MNPAVEERTDAMNIGQELKQEVAVLPKAVLRITNTTEYGLVCHAIAERKEFIKRAKAKMDPVCDMAHKAWKATTALRSEVIDPVEAEVRTYSSAIVAWDREQERLRQEAIRAQEEAARAAELAAQEANEFRLPFEPEVDVAVAVQEAANVVVIPERQAPVAGISTKFKPWAGRVTDMDAFLKFVVANKRYELIQVNGPALNQLAKSLGETMANVIPGAEAFREKTVASR